MLRYLTTTEIARELRKNQTPAERILWELLRNRKLAGYKFLRQHPIVYDHTSTPQKFFVADFYCAAKKLVIELDGEIHKFRKRQDKLRDVVLENKGYRVLRINNEETKNQNLLLAKIREFLEL